ncbi:MAG: hypothetical protein ABW185_00620 [Sedimenticola sp.]
MGKQKRRTARKADNAGKIANAEMSGADLSSGSESDILTHPLQQTLIARSSVTGYDSDTSMDSCPPLEHTIPCIHIATGLDGQCGNFNSSAPVFDVEGQHRTLDNGLPTHSTHTCRPNTPSNFGPGVHTHITCNSDGVDTQMRSGDIGAPAATTHSPNNIGQSANMVFSSDVTRNFVASIVDLAEAVKGSNDRSQQNHQVMSDVLLKTNETLSHMSRFSQQNADILRNGMSDMAQQMGCMRDSINLMSEMWSKDRQPLRENEHGPNRVMSPVHSHSQTHVDSGTAYLGINVLTQSTPIQSRSSIACSTTHMDSRPRSTQSRSTTRSQSSHRDDPLTQSPLIVHTSGHHTSSSNAGRSNTEMRSDTNTPIDLTLSRQAPVASLPTIETIVDHTRQTTSNAGHTKLPKFTGEGRSSWKVWYTRFTTVAEIHHWDENRCLSELVQHLDGSAADFVFDQISDDCRFNYMRLVREINSRFLTEETRKTYRIQFGKRIQRYRESVEDFASELKRLYDRAYERKDPEIRQQALVDRFLAGLRDQELQFAVEWSKEPSTIEEAVRHVIHYMEARQGRGSEKHNEYDALSRTNHHSRKVTFSDDSDDSDDCFETHGRDTRSPLRRSPHSVRQVVNASGSPGLDTKPSPSVANASSNLVQAMEQFVACFGNNSRAAKGKDIPVVSAVRDMANIQCFQCRGFGHYKRECPELVYQHAPIPQAPRMNNNTGSGGNGSISSHRPNIRYRSGSRDRHEPQSTRNLSLN